MIKQLLKEDINFIKICQRAIPIISRMDILSISDIINASGLKSFGNLEYVGGSIFLYYNDEIETLNKIKYIGGDLSIYYSDLIDLGDLEHIERGMDTMVCLLKSLGKLKYIGGQTDLEFSDLENLGNLEEVNGSLNLTGSWKLKNLGKLKSVRGNLRLDSTLITLKQTKNIKVGGDLVTNDQIQTED